MLSDFISKKLASNKSDITKEAIRLLIKIADNILKDPNNTQKRSLQKHNAVILNKIIPASGAVDCLKLMGFIENESSFQLPPDVPSHNLQEVRSALLNWSPKKSYDEKTVQSSADEDIPIKPIVLPRLIKISSQPFLQRIEECFHSALVYKDKGLQRRAKNLIPVAILEEKAQLKLRKVQEQIKKKKIADCEISIQDMLILELLAWFKDDFFTWVDSPECEKCGETTTFSHLTQDPALMVYTNRVEMHKCSSCNALTPFPRYNDLNILLETRRGRCGEWANTFTLLCCAMDWDARHVIDEGDHVWTEVYSTGQKRWLHCDPCENICDRPLIYECGWKKEISYVIAYSGDEVQDVTWRYTSKHGETLAKRRKCAENELVQHLMKLRKNRQEAFSVSRRQYLTKRVVLELVELMVEKKAEAKDGSGRSSGSLGWRAARGEIEEQVEEGSCSFVFQFKDEHITGENLSIRYSCVADKYEMFAGKRKVREIENWAAGVFKRENIFRKVEKDWKMVYLCRKDGASSGTISWKFHLESEDNVIESIDVKFLSKTFETGKISAKLLMDDFSIAVPTESGVLKTSVASNVNSFVLSAVLMDGKGDVAWQHAQLFRRHLENSDFDFILNVNTKKKI